MSEVTSYFYRIWLRIILYYFIRISPYAWLWKKHTLTHTKSNLLYFIYSLITHYVIKIKILYKCSFFNLDIWTHARAIWAKMKRQIKNKPYIQKSEMVEGKKCDLSVIINSIIIYAHEFHGNDTFARWRTHNLKFMPNGWARIIHLRHTCTIYPSKIVRC